MKSSITSLTGKLDTWIERSCAFPVVGPLLRHRFTKFGTVGLAGTGVNLVVLFFGQEFLFLWIAPPAMRLKASLGLAIFVSTLHNYLWNRAWTWRERRRYSRSGFFIQMIQYFLACGLSIALQYGFTLLMAVFLHYMAANVAAIGLAAVVTYLVNDVWTFTRRPSGRFS
jgi:dolichol-phosphate mannosyltransferase